MSSHAHQGELFIAKFSVRLSLIWHMAASMLSRLTQYSDAFKIQSHLMFFDSELNSAQTMLRNIYNAFTETATKMWAYARCLPPQKQPSAELVIRMFYPK